MTAGERELWLARRRALLIEVKAIEEQLCTPRVTVTVEREVAARLAQEQASRRPPVVVTSA